MRLILLFVIAAIPYSSIAVECVKGGQEVTFQGVIHRETFPGPPNYRSISEGDEAETYWILTIDEPVCVIAFSMEDDSPYTAAKSATRFQLVLFGGASVYDEYKTLLGRHVAVKGQVFVGVTGHYHTKGALDVTSIQAMATK